MNTVMTVLCFFLAGFCNYSFLFVGRVQECSLVLSADATKTKLILQASHSWNQILTCLLKEIFNIDSDCTSKMSIGLPIFIWKWSRFLRQYKHNKNSCINNPSHQTAMVISLLNSWVFPCQLYYVDYLQMWYARTLLIYLSQSISIIIRSHMYKLVKP